VRADDFGVYPIVQPGGGGIANHSGRSTHWPVSSRRSPNGSVIEGPPTVLDGYQTGYLICAGMQIAGGIWGCC